MSAQTESELAEVQGLDLPQPIIELLDLVEEFWNEMADFQDLNESLKGN